MSTFNINRRRAIQFIGATTGVAIAEKATGSTPAATGKRGDECTLCLNMATIRGHKLGFVKELETASAAGFRSVEIWTDSLQDYLNHGGTIANAGKRLGDLGLKVEDLISFNEWIVDDNATRQKGAGRDET
jgi:hypothetical protein